MKRSIRINMMLVISFLCVVSFQNCSFKKSTSMELDPISAPASAASQILSSDSPAPVLGNSIEAQAITLLQNKCYACHGISGVGGVAQINNPTYLISTGQIIPGNPSGSPIFDAVNAGRMPIGSPALTSTEISLLNSWILAGANSPAEGTVVEPVVIPLNGTFKSIQSNIIVPKCLACHSSTLAKDGVRVDSYAEVKKYISGASVQKSKLYQITSNGEMPPKPYDDLTSQELNALADWISSGSPNN